MRHKIQAAVFLALLMSATTILTVVAAAQEAAPVSLQEQLSAQYKLAKVVWDSNGASLAETGTVLAIQKGGILGVSQQTVIICPVKYQDGTLHAPNLLCVSMVKTTRNFQVGEKVYPTKIDVNLKNDRVGIFIVACDACNGTEPQTYYKSEVSFQFAKGSLAKADAGQIEDTIGQVLAISDEAAGQPGGQNAQVGPGPSQPPAPPAAQAEPQVVQLGETEDQVVAAIGKPDQIFNLGIKQIWKYRDVKVTFLNGKVADVQ